MDGNGQVLSAFKDSEGICRFGLKIYIDISDTY